MNRPFFLATLFLMSSCFAALPPLSQSKKEIAAILESQELMQLLPQSDIIEQIMKAEGGYLLVTNYRTLFIRIQYEEQKQLGPARFTLEFQKPMPIYTN